ncbi:MAG: glycosyltransferase family 4 protein [Candidatus Dormibacteraeota bacterium]|nr:glycosyltransferase family 4 protein [Candidatus Dormibacteraeota bacterium]MBV9524741.1 glycosyltransferase family 4 protein [Candidatus Dormibacteraeota bacterium]
MKICLVSPYDFMHPGGVTEHVRHLAAELRERGHSVTVLAPSSRVGDDHGIPGYVRIGRSVAVRGNGSVARIGLSFHLVRRVRALLAESDYDVVHYHEPLVPALPITVLRFHRGANVGTFHAMARRNLGYYYGRPFLKRYFNRLHAMIAVSAPARDFVARYFDGDYRIVPNGIDCSRFNPALEPVPSTRTPGQATLLFVGRLESRKGFPTLLEAYAAVRRERSDVRLVVVGDGPMRWGYERQAEALGVPDVQFSGFVGGEMIPRYYASADLFGSPATGGESFGIVLLEAMASGVPVMASAIPGFSQVVSHERDGVLLPPKQPEVWAGALRALLDDPARRRRMGEAGVHKARQYDWSRVVDEVLDVYREARLRARSHEAAAGVHSQVPGLG